MPAHVHQLTIAGQDDDFGHLHLVVIHIDADQRLCIPAYDTAGQKVNDLVNALHSNGIFQGVGWIEIDNAKEIKFHGKWTGKLAKWVPYKLSRVEKSRLGKPIGEMSDKGLAQVVECLLKLHAAKPYSTLTEEELKKVKRVAKGLGVVVPAGI